MTDFTHRQLGRSCRAGVLVLAGLLLFASFAPAQEEISPSRKGFDAAVKLFDEGKGAEALAAFQAFEKNFGFSGLVPQAISYQGWCHFNLGKHKEAAETFERLIKGYANSPLIPGAVLKLAECYRELKDVPKAIATYKQFQKDYADPPHELLPQAYLGEAWVLYKDWQSKNTKDKPADPKLLDGPKKIAEGVARKFAGNISVRLDALFLLGQIYNEEGNFNEARKIYDQIRAMRNNPRAAEALFLAGEAMYDAGQTLQGQNKLDEANKRFKDAIEYYQGVPSKASLLRGIDEQIQQLRALIPKQLENRAAIQARINSLGQLKQQINAQQDLRAVALFRTANGYQFIGYADESVVVYRHFLRLFPKDPLAPQAHFALIQSLTQAGRAKESEEESEIFKKLYPDVKDLGDYMGFLTPKNQFDTSQYEKALEGFTKFVATTKDVELKQTAEFYVAACYYGLERFDQARDAFAKFLETYPSGTLVPDATFRRGRCHFELYQRTEDKDAKKANLTEAIKYYELVRTKHPKPELLPDITFQLGYLYSYLSEYDPANLEKAVAAFQDYVAKWGDQPLAVEALYQMGGLLLRLQKIEDAVATYQKIVNDHPGTEFACAASFDIGRAYAVGKQNDKMIEALTAFAEKCPDHARKGDALYAIASDYEGRGKIPEALAAYRQVVTAAATSNPNEGLLNSAIGSLLRITALLEKDGKLDDAVTECQQFIQQFQQHQAALRAVIPEIAKLYTNAKRVKDGIDKLNALATEFNHVDDIRVPANTTILELLLDQKDTQGAYAQALKLLADPKAAALPGASLNAIGRTFLKKSSPAEALDAFGKALKQDPADARVAGPALAGMAEAHFTQKQAAEAEAAADRLLKEFPQTPSLHGQYSAVWDARLVKGKIAASKGQKKVAVDLYNGVMQNAKGEAAAEAALLAGNFFLQDDNDPKTALPYYLRVTFLSGGALAEEAAFRTGETQEGIRKKLPAGTDKEKLLKNQALNAAINSYKSYLNRFPNGKFAPDARKKLEELERQKPPAP